jgi:phospholipase/lecithinase/hemolysin
LIGYGTAKGPAYLTPAGVITNVAQAFCAFSAPPASGQANCTNFAQGGSMVSNPNGIGHSTGALTIPVTQQVQNYLTQFSTFTSGQLITVLAGNNDVFTALGNVSAQVTAAVTQAATQAAQAGTPLTAAQIATVQQQATSQAVAVAQATVGAAADQLAGVVQNIIAKGGQYVMVYTLPDSSVTPFGRGLPYTGATQPAAPPAGYVCNNQDPTQPCYLLSNLVQVFNQRLTNDLQGQPVKMLDGFALLNQEIANPSQFGFTNITTPWCDPATTSSLLCNVNTPNTAAGASTTNLGAWLFADSVHPTPAGYQVIANATLAAMKSFGWN